MKNLQTKWRQLLAGSRQALTTRTARVGGYSFLLGLIVLAILVAVNVLAGALPSRFTQVEISAAQLYSLTSDTKVVATNLDEDVTIYWIAQAGKEDTVIQKLLDRYSDLTDHITVVKKDPDTYPTFAKQYTDETVQNNSLVVECGSKSRYIGYDSIYNTDMNAYYSTGSVSRSFDGEGQITSAIDYVTTETLPQVYLLSGHGEAALSDAFSSQLERANYETVSDFSLLNVDDPDREHYAFTEPYVLMPDIGESDITAPLTEGAYHVIVPIAAGLTLNEGSTATALLTTSDSAFSKLSGYAMTSYDREDDDPAGPFTLAVSAESAQGGKLVWVASDYLLDDLYNSYSSGANMDLAMNSLSWMIGQADSVSIRSKSLNSTYLTISSSSAAWLKVCMIGIVPLAFLLLGIDEVIRRRKMV